MLTAGRLRYLCCCCLADLRSQLAAQQQLLSKREAELNRDLSVALATADRLKARASAAEAAANSSALEAKQQIAATQALRTQVEQEQQELEQKQQQLEVSSWHRGLPQLQCLYVLCCYSLEGDCCARPFFCSSDRSNNHHMSA